MRSLIIPLISILVLANTSKATTYTSIANGSWSASTTWSPAGVPSQSDNIILASPYKVTSTADIAIGTSSGGSLTINTGANLDMGTRDISFSWNATVINNGTLSIATLELNGSASFTNGGILNPHKSITLSTSGSFINSGTLTTVSLELDDATAFTNNGTISTGTFETNSTSSFTDNGIMTVTTSMGIESSSTLIVGTGVTINNTGSFENNSSTGITDNGAILVTGTATFDGGTSISGSGYLTGGEIDNNKNISLWGVEKSYFPCHHCTIPNNAGLPIALVSYAAAFTGDAVQLQWLTATEINNSFFTVSRSTDGVNYTTLATINGAGNSTDQHSYTYTDNTAPGGVYYYKLQQTDYDGTVATDGVVAVTVNMPFKGLEVFPNPVKDRCIVSFSDAVQENFQLTVYDCMGREVIARNVETNIGDNTLELYPSTLTPGMYFISLPVNGSAIKARFIKE